MFLPTSLSLILAKCAGDSKSYHLLFILDFKNCSQTVHVVNDWQSCVWASHISLGSEITPAAFRSHRAGSATVKPQVTLHLLPLRV